MQVARCARPVYPVMTTDLCLLGDRAEHQVLQLVDIRPSTGADPAGDLGNAPAHMGQVPSPPFDTPQAPHLLPAYHSNADNLSLWRAFGRLTRSSPGGDGVRFGCYLRVGVARRLTLASAGPNAEFAMPLQASACNKAHPRCVAAASCSSSSRLPTPSPGGPAGIV